MSVAKRNLRGLRDLRTLAGQADEASLPHRAYMKLACLEMEKARRKTERNGAVQRLKTINARIQEIETEQAAVRRTMPGAADGPGGATAGSGPEPISSRAKKRAFKVKY
jgi:hypothetical protein